MLYLIGFPVLDLNARNINATTELLGVVIHMLLNNFTFVFAGEEIICAITVVVTVVVCIETFFFGPSNAAKLKKEAEKAKKAEEDRLSKKAEEVERAGFIVFLKIPAFTTFQILLYIFLP